jgi:hypothetical protein
MAIVSRPFGHEPDLLTGSEFAVLIICDLDGKSLLEVNSPAEGWSHDALEAFDYYQVSPDGWDAYLGSNNHWIGSSEV